MKILIDMNLSAQWAKLLRDKGIEALHWSQVGLPNDPDEEIMAYAAFHHFIILTKDLDYGAMLAASHRGKPSVVQLRIDILKPDLGLFPRLLNILRAYEEHLDAGGLITVDPKRVRLKVLPFSPEYPASN